MSLRPARLYQPNILMERERIFRLVHKREDQVRSVCSNSMERYGLARQVSHLECWRGYNRQ